MPKIPVTPRVTQQPVVQQELGFQEPLGPTMLEQKDNFDADAFSQHSFIKAKTDFDSQIKQLEAQGPNLDAPTFNTKDALGEFDEFATQSLAEAPDDRSRNFLGANLTQFREGYANRLVETEAKLDIQKRKQRAVNTVAISKQRLAEDPRLLSEAINDVDLISAYLPADQKREFAEGAKKDLASATIKSIAAKDPSAATAELANVTGLYNAEERADLEQNIEVSQRQQDVEKQRNEDVAVNAIDSLDQKMQGGDIVSDEEFDTISAEMGKLDNPEIQAAFKERKAILKEKQRLRTLSAPELEAAKLSENSEIREFAIKTQKMASETPLEYELKSGSLAFNPVDLGDASSLTARKGDALFAAKRNNTDPQFLTNQEVSQMSEQLTTSSADDMVHFADQIKTSFGEYSNNMLSEMEKTNPVETHALGMMIDENASSEFAKNAIRGQKLFRERPDLKTIYFGENMTDPDNSFARTGKEAFASAEGSAVTIQETANAIYADQISKTGRTEFDEGIYNEAIRRAAGGTDDPRTGIRPFNGKQTVLPTGVTDDAFENHINSILPDDLSNFATFEYAGPNTYRIMVFGEDITGGAGVEISKEAIEAPIDFSERLAESAEEDRFLDEGL